MSSHVEAFTLTAKGGAQLAAYRWAAPNARAVLLLVHGYAEHAGRHARLAEEANRAGFDVWAFDQRNHGASGGKVRGSVNGFELAVGDVAALQEAALAEVRGVPHFIFGHSMGGAVALKYALEHGERLRAGVLSAPFLKDPAARPPFMRGAARTLAALFPTLPVTRIPASAISRDAGEVRRYMQDPQIYHGGVRADAAATMLSEGERLLAAADALAVPLLVLHGDADQVASVEGSRELARASSMIQLEEVAGGYHELHHEPLESGVPERVRGRAIQWLQERI